MNTPRVCARIVWAIAEHIDLEGLDPLLADDPDDPLNIIVANIHKVLFNIDSSADTTNRLQDVQAVLLSAQRLGSRHPRAGQLLTKELEEFRTNGLADSVNKHQCRLILQRLKYVASHPESRYTLYSYNLNKDTLQVFIWLHGFPVFSFIVVLLFRDCHFLNFYNCIFYLPNKYLHSCLMWRC